MPPDKLRLVFDSVGQDYDLGDFNSFRQAMARPEKRRTFYETASRDYDLGEFGQFDSLIASSLPETAVMERPEVEPPVEAQPQPAPTAEEKPVITAPPAAVKPAEKAPKKFPTAVRAFDIAAQHLIPETEKVEPEKPEFELPTISEAPEESLIKKILGQWEPTPTEKIAHAQNVYQVAKQYNLPISKVRHQIKLADRKGGMDSAVNSFFTSAIAFGMATNAPATLVGIGAFMAIKELVNVGVSIYKDEKYQALAGKGFSDLPSEESSHVLKKTIEAAELIGTISLMGAGIKMGKAPFEKFTKDIVVDNKAPQYLYIEPEQVKAATGKGEFVRDLDEPGMIARTKLLEWLGITGDKVKLAEENGVAVPTESVTWMVDKPWFYEIKNSFRLMPAKKARLADYKFKPVEGTPTSDIGEVGPTPELPARLPEKPSVIPAKPAPVSEGRPTQPLTAQPAPEEVEKYERVRENIRALSEEQFTELSQANIEELQADPNNRDYQLIEQAFAEEAKVRAVMPKTKLGKMMAAITDAGPGIEETPGVPMEAPEAAKAEKPGEITPEGEKIAPAPPEEFVEAKEEVKPIVAPPEGEIAEKPPVIPEEVAPEEKIEARPEAPVEKKWEWDTTTKEMKELSGRAFIEFKKEMREKVQQALAEGKPVPAEVLADYPDLKAKTGKKEEGKKPTKGKLIPRRAEDGSVVWTTEPVEEAAAEVAAEGPNSKIAKVIADNLKANKATSWQELFQIADQAYGGTQAEGKYTVTDAYNAMELGVNQRIDDSYLTVRPTGAITEAAEKIKALKSQVLDLLPTQTKRTGIQKHRQQFSTPPTLAFAANWVANIGTDDVVLEPSAGNGGLAIFAKATNATTIVNEIDEKRRVNLQALGFNRVENANAEHLNSTLPIEIKPTVVVMNPPFSATERMIGKKILGTGGRHVEQALARLEPNGRLVAILGRGMAIDTPFFKKWWKSVNEKNEYTLRADIGVSGKEYKKYGTTFDNQLLVIDKMPTNADIELVTGFVENVEQLIPLLKDVRDERISAGKQVARQPEGEGALRKSHRRAAKPREAIRPEPDVATGERGAGTGGRRSGAVFVPPGKQAGEAGVEPVAERPGERVPGRTAGRSERKGPVHGGEQPIGTRTPQTQESRPIGAASLLETERVVPSAALKEDADAQIVYSRYRPTVTAKGAKPHSGDLVESVAMAAVNPPAVDYHPNLEKNIVETGSLSDAQLEAVILAGATHGQTLPDGTTRGFFIGDGTGVGKGREIAGIIRDNWNRGRKKSVWVSEKWKLISDATRDLKGIQWKNPPIFQFKGDKYKYGKKIENDNGILFVTYGTLRGSRTTEGGAEIMAQTEKRINQIVEWLGKDFDGVLVFDESHNMANATDQKGARGTQKASQTALTGIELQSKLPNAKIVYVSATGATEIMNLAYAPRLGLWGEGTAFSNKDDFFSSILSGGLATMEAVARDMKSLGIYVSRSLSYRGIKYNPISHNLAEQQRDLYDRMANAWITIMQGAEDNYSNLQYSSREISAARSALYGAQQRFFSSILTSMSTPTVITSLEEDIKAGKAPVLQIVNTDESQLERSYTKMQKEGLSLDDLDTSPRDAILNYVQEHYPTIQHEKYTDDEGNEQTRIVYDSEGKPAQDPEALRAKGELIVMINDLPIPDSPLRLLLDHFGGDSIAEITGRKRRIYTNPTIGEAVEEKRNQKQVEKEIDDFNAGKRDILIFSNAGGTGASYHADLDYKNQKERIHYGWQMGWQTNRAVQGLGRTHRTHQKQSPTYKLITTDVPAHSRFIATIMRRLDQLGAITRGQRQATSQGLFSEQPNIESEYGEKAINRMMREIVQNNIPNISLDEVEKILNIKLTDQWGQLIEGKIPPIKRFLNRLLMTPLEMQQRFYDTFFQIFEENIEHAIANGTYDMGVETVPVEDYKTLTEQVVHKEKRSGAVTKYQHLELTIPNDILTWERLQERFEGVAVNEISGKAWAFSRERNRTDRWGSVEKIRTLINSVNRKRVVTAEGFEKYQIQKGVAAKKAWEEELKNTPETYTDDLHLVTGTLLPVWNRLPQEQGAAKIKRIRAATGQSVLGRVIPEDRLKQTLDDLGAERKARQIDTSSLAAQIIDQDYSARLANSWIIKRSIVSGDKRIEVRGPSYYDGQLLEQMGVFSETIAYKTRHFIPVGKQGQQVIDRLLQTHPVVKIISPERKELSGEDISFASSKKPAETAGLSVAAVERSIKSFKDKFKIPIRVLGSVENLEGRTREAAQNELKRGNIISGFYDPQANEIVILADGVSNSDELLKLIIPHEITHYGTKGMLGEKAYAGLLKDLQEDKAIGPEIRKLMKENGWKADYAASEWWAGNAEGANFDSLKKPSLIQRVIFYLKKWLRKVFGAKRVKFSDAEIKDLLRKSYQYAQREEGKRVGETAEPAFRTRPTTDRQARLLGLLEPTGGQPVERTTFELPPETRWEFLRRYVQNSMNRLAIAQKQVKKTGKEITPDLNAYQQSVLEIGRATDQVEKFRDRMIAGKNSFVKRLIDGGIDIDDFGDYLTALHTPERRRVMIEKRIERLESKPETERRAEKIDDLRTRLADKDDSFGSGMSENEAAQIIAEMQKDHPAITEFIDEFYQDVTEAALQIRFDAGLISEESYQAMKDTYRNYVPLKGKAGIEPTRPGIGKKSGIMTSGVRRAKGRESQADNPFIQAMVDYTDAIVRAEQNKVRQSFLRLVEDNPEPGIWETQKLQYMPVYDENGEVQYYDPLRKYADNVLEVMNEGKVTVITIKDAPLAEAMKNLGMERSFKTLAAINSYLRAVNIMLSPEFLITNFERDLQTALVNISGEESAKLASQVTKGIPKAMKGIWSNLHGKGGAWAGVYAELKEAGGKVSWMNLESTEEMAGRIEKELRHYRGHEMMPKRILKQMGRLIENSNEMVEMGVRLSYYKALRDSGKSAADAAQAAKELTVNFNTRGQIGPLLNCLYLFANAAIQGAFRMFRVLKHRRARQIVAGLALLSFIQSLFNRWRDEDAWEQVSDYNKDNYWLFMLPNGKAVGIKVPYGYNIFKVIGNLAEEAAFGNLTFAQTARRFFGAANDAFNPLGGGSLSQFISPTATDVFVQIAENKNFFGGPIYKEQAPYQPAKPRSQMYFERVNVYARRLTDWLNRLTGGTEKVSGVIDVNPELLDHLIDFVGGGLGRFITNSVNLGAMLLTERDTPEIGKIPMVRQFLKESWPGTDIRTIYDLLDESQRNVFGKRKSIKFANAIRRASKAGTITGEQREQFEKEFQQNQADALVSIQGRRSRESILDEWESYYALPENARPRGRIEALREAYREYNKKARDTGQKPITRQLLRNASRRGQESRRKAG